MCATVGVDVGGKARDCVTPRGRRPSVSLLCCRGSRMRTRAPLRALGAVPVGAGGEHRHGEFDLTGPGVEDTAVLGPPVRPGLFPCRPGSERARQRGCCPSSSTSWWRLQGTTNGEPRKPIQGTPFPETGRPPHRRRHQPLSRPLRAPRFRTSAPTGHARQHPAHPAQPTASTPASNCARRDHLNRVHRHGHQPRRPPSRSSEHGTHGTTHARPCPSRPRSERAERGRAHVRAYGHAQLLTGT